MNCFSFTLTILGFITSDPPLHPFEEGDSLAFNRLELMEYVPD